MVCFVVTLLVGSIAGIVVAFVLALINLAKRAANPAIDVLESSGDPGESLLTDAPRGTVTAPGVIVIRLAAPLFFANGDVFTQAVKSAVTSAGDQVRHLVIDMEAVTDIDVTGAESFETLQGWLAAHDVSVAFSRVRPNTLARLKQLDLLTDQSVYLTNRGALTALSR
ncbi:sodium-independent anion transporter [Leifsonia sp. AG29]|uniref:sodium-independent anion transporter n=1 Tax=Leifsonia sp. AG29 TaxID=2598860 RepID=UPI002279131D|nr:sodium-independent anion transporter [Leifsonia sp. AG29]